jgi:hypothetical protein
MKILDSYRSETGWVTAIIEGRWVQAKIYNEPSIFGINEGRVSKLYVGKTDIVDSKKIFFEQICYHYDRGLDFNKAPEGLIDKIVAKLETLPKLFPEQRNENEVKEEKDISIKKNRYNL